MNLPPGAIPPWLKSSTSSEKLINVLGTLSKRERARNKARKISRSDADASRLARMAHTITPNRKSSLPDDRPNFYAVAVGAQPQNVRANRYLDLEPYDRTRVIVGESDHEELEMGVDEHGRGVGRYLNASWVREYYGGKWWIATQAPLPNTVHAFLSVVLQPISRPPTSLLSDSIRSKTSQIRTIVQLTPNFEEGRQKAHLYFPPNVGESWQLQPEPGADAHPIEITLVDYDTIDVASCIKSTVSVTQLDRTGRALHKPTVFQHMLYHAWPDHGVPDQEELPSLLRFIYLVDQFNKVVPPEHFDIMDPDPPIMVGCSAGVGRTGTFIALSSLLRAHKLLGSPSSNPIAAPLPHSPALPVSPLGPLPLDLANDMVAQEVDSLREQRPSMVQREEQILMIYELLQEAFMESK